MPTPIITVDVDDEAFKEFQALFAKYKADVAAMPDAWRAAGSAADSMAKKGATGAKTVAAAWASFKVSANPFAKVNKEVRAFSELSAKAKTTQEKFQVAAIGTGKVFGGMAKSTKSIAGGIKDATFQLLKWASLTSVFAGLAGGGGLFGIERLAAHSSASRREAQGLGVTPGEHDAAKINYSKLVDVDSMLSNINAARQDVTKRWAFSAAGLAPSQMEGKSNAEVLKLLLPLLKSTNARAGGTQQGAQAHGLLEFTDMATLTRLKAVKEEEIAEATAAYEKDKRALALADDTQRAWQSLDIQLQRAGSTIENMFIRKLASLTGPVNKLSSAFTRAVKVFLDSPKIEKWLKELGEGLESLADYLVSDKFQKDVDATLDALDVFAGAILSAGKTLGRVFGLGSEKTLRASEYRKLDALEKLNPALAKMMRERLENPTETAAKDKRTLGETLGGWHGPGFSHQGKTEKQQDQESITAALAGKNGAQIKAILDELQSQDPTAPAPKAFGKTASGTITYAPGMTPPAWAKPAAPPDVAPVLLGGLNVPAFAGAPTAPPAAGAAPSASPRPDTDALYRTLELRNNLPAGLLEAIEKKESWTRGKPISHAVGPVTAGGGQAKGPFQLMDPTAKAYGVADPFDLKQAATGAASMMHDLLAKYKGDVAKALAAYNWGSGKLDKYGEKNAPAETRDYVKTIMSQLKPAPSLEPQDDARAAVKESAPEESPRSQATNNSTMINNATYYAPARAARTPAPAQAKITVINSTGGNAVVITNQVAQ